MTKTTAEEARQVAERANDAHSRDRYTDAAWITIAQRLAAEGATTEEIDWLLRSKHMRWAADAANRSYSATAGDFARYVVTFIKSTLPWQTLLNDARANLRKAPAEVPTTGADLAGACEGEDIADLIDFARTVRDETSPSGEPGDAERQLAILRDKATRILTAIERRMR